MAHPLRVRLLELLADGGPATASGLARSVGQTSGTTSYHLRRLAAVGLIEDARDQGNGRDRYWQRAHAWTLDTRIADSPATRQHAQVVAEEVLQNRVERLRTWHERAERWPTAWREAALESTVRLDLTHEEAAELSRRLTALISEYRTDDRADSGADGRRRVAVHTEVLPLGDPEG